MSHPFGDLISHHLHRKHGLSQSKLAKCIHQEDAVVANMCHGKRLFGAKARERVVSIIGCFHEWGVLDFVEEANALLRAAGMADLDERQSEEATLLSLLKAESAVEQRVSPPPESKPAQVPPVTALHQLPPPPRDFTGREAELHELVDKIEHGVTISGLGGMGGIGKTALALMLAQRVAPRYPDAQFYLDLKGTSERPLSIANAAAHIIRSYIPEFRLPKDLDQLLARYRSLLHGKRALLLMDNAANAEQVTPLIPPAGCIMLVTSRQRFTLPGMFQMNLDVLPVADARTLLLTIAPRIGDQADTIAEFCGYLPLALRAAGSLVTNTDDLDPRVFAKQLNDEHTRLERIGTVGIEIGVAASFNRSYAQLSEEAQRVFRMLAIFPTSFDATAEEAVCEDVAHTQLSNLVQRSLVEWNDVAARYQLHDLVRLFADSRLSDNEHTYGQRLHATHYVGVLQRAVALYRQGGEESRRGLELFDTDWENIRAGQVWAAAHAMEDDPTAELCINYSTVSRSLLDLRLSPREQIRWREAALDSTRRLKQRLAEGRLLGFLGPSYFTLGEYSRAIEYCQQALVIFRAVGDRISEAATLLNLGLPYDQLGETRRAIECYEQALTISREIRDRRVESDALENLGIAYKNMGDYQHAIELYEQTLVIDRERGDRLSEGITLIDLGEVYGKLGDPGRAIEFCENALDLVRDFHDRRQEANALGKLGSAYAQLGEYRRAIEYYEQALAIDRDMGHRYGIQDSLFNLGQIYSQLAEYRRAIEYYEQALAIVREMNNRHSEGAILFQLALVADSLGNRARAIHHAKAALAIFVSMDDPKAEDVRKQLMVWEETL